MPETSSSTSISPRLERIAKLAKQSPRMAFTTLAHHIDIDWLREAHRRTRKSGAPGVDGQSSEEYAADLEGNLQSLLARAKSGTYRATFWLTSVPGGRRQPPWPCRVQSVDN
jgi:RNA-directed DNA polymerase